MSFPHAVTLAICSTATDIMGKRKHTEIIPFAPGITFLQTKYHRHLVAMSEQLPFPIHISKRLPKDARKRLKIYIYCSVECGARTLSAGGGTVITFLPYDIF